MSIDKLSSTDQAFLDIEAGSMGMHVGATLVFEGGGLVGADGALDAGRIAALIGAGIDEVPRFRQCVREVAGLGAVWVDDANFRLEDHVIHTAIPRPGGVEQLMRLSGRVFAQPLDRRRPLWEIWLVEGLEGGKFGMLIKAHHAMADGIAGIGMLASMFRAEPTDIEPRSRGWRPRSEPGKLELARSLAVDRARGVVELFQQARGALDHRAETLSMARGVASGLLEMLREGLAPADATAVNPSELSSRRVFGGIRLDLSRVREVKRLLGGTINDVALTAVTGGLRRYLARRGDLVDGFHDFRAMIPVNLRSRQGAAAASAGNHVSLVLARLPVDEPDARRRFDQIKLVCEHLKSESHEIEGAALIEQIGDMGGPNVVSAVFRVAMQLRAFNVVVTNVPGPSVPLFLGPSRLESMWGLVPLFSHQGLGVAPLSYHGGLFVGLHGDPVAVADLDTVGQDIQLAFDELAALADGL
jgi:WS/DGAT/MGAT family acyltransferase